MTGKLLFVSDLRGQVSLPFMITPPPIELANLGMADSIILMIMALVVFGPRRLPQIGRQIGKLMYEFRKASNDFKFQMEEELRSAEEAERRKKDEERLRALGTAPEQASVSADPPATVNTIETPLPSPYPGEGNYPPQYPPEATNAAPPVEVTTAPVESTVPRIMPPSTGETIAASWPGRLAELQASEPAAAETAPSVAPSAQADGTSGDIATPSTKQSDDTAAEALNHG
jgi:sec-independent protein translocase protein TatB